MLITSARACISRHALAAALLLLGAPAALAQVQNPPIVPVLINVFPSRDFVSAEGYDDADRLLVKVIHPDGTTRTTNPSQLLAPSGGIAEVNHPGGACWFGTTPDIRAGDVVQIDVLAGPNAGRRDATTVTNITCKRPVQPSGRTIQVHGTAQDPFGNPLPLADLECRLLSPGDLFDANGRRTLRAPGDGFLTYDAPGSIHWTATFQNLSTADVERSLAADSRIMQFIGLTATTIFENGVTATPGPIAGCEAPLEILPPPPGSELIPPTVPGSFAASVSHFNQVTLTWRASTDNVGVTSYGVYRDGIAVANVQNPAGDAPAPTGFIDRSVPAGTHVYAIDAADEVGNRSARTAGISVVTVPQPAANTPANEPPVLPVSLLAFPSRDFVSCDGFLSTDHVDVLIIRDGQVISSALNQTPVGGIVEINHPGGACWEGITPDLRYGDILRTIARRNDGSIRTADQTRVSGVTCLRAVMVQNDNPSTGIQEGIVEIHGTAMDGNGQPIPLDQLEQRMVAGGDRFDLNGKRTLRAGPGSDGIITYDADNNPLGINWTARYIGLNGNDVARAVGGNSSTTGIAFPGAEARIMWLGRNPALLQEATIYENSDINVPGAMPGCGMPFEDLDVTPPTAPSQFSDVPVPGGGHRITWAASTDNWSVAHYRVYRDGVPIDNVPATQLSYLDFPPAGSHEYHVVAFDHASPRGPGARPELQVFNGFGTPWGNASPPSSAGGSPLPDTSPPSTPTDLADTVDNADVTLTWTASTDNIGVVSYGVYREGVRIADVASPSTSFTDVGRPTGLHHYSVDAVDAADNRSPRTAQITVIVGTIVDETAPTVPSGVGAVVTPDLNGRDVVVSWGASSDNIAVAGYGVYRDGVKITDTNAAARTYRDNGLAPQSYVYTVDAFDHAGNRSEQSAGATVVIAYDSPRTGHALIAFPSSDYVTATGYPDSEGPYRFTLHRGATVVQSTTMNSDPSGTLELNHAGGACWNAFTPDLRAGDIVRITNAAGVAEQTTVANVAAQRAEASGPNSVVVHGFARDAAGLPLPIGQLQHRLLSTGSNFDLSGARTLRAGAGLDGTLSYDAPGSIRWTASYTGLSAADMFRACGGVDGVTTFVPAESRAMWLGRQPSLQNEQTIQVTGAGIVGGPETACSAAAEAPRPAGNLSPVSLAFGDVDAIPATSSAQQLVTIRNTGGVTMTVTAVYFAGLHPRDFTLAGAVPAAVAPGSSFQVAVRFSPLALGLRQATLNLACDAANTTDLAVALSGVGTESPAPGLPGMPSSALVQGGELTVETGSSILFSTIPVRIAWAPSTGLVTDYELEMSANGGGWEAIALPAPDVTTMTLPLAMGTAAAPKSYQFRVRALNHLAATTWVLGSAINLTPLDQTNTLVKYLGVWNTASTPGAYGGSVRYSTNNKSSASLPNRATFSVPGSIAWIAAMGPDRGMASVRVDLGPAVLVDLYSPVPRQANVVFAVAGLAPGRQHSITVQVLGTKNPASTSTRVDMDGFVILNGSSVRAPLEAGPVSGTPVPDEQFMTTPGPAALSFANIAPNPSRGTAMLSFTTPRDGNVELAVMDIQGRRVNSVHNGMLSAGEHHVAWDGRDASGQNTQPGVYFAVLRFGDKALTKRIVRVQ